MKKYVLDTNLYIAADLDLAKAEELISFYSAFMPFTYLHGVVAQELLLGAVDVKRCEVLRKAYITPFENRNRIIAPTFRAWRRSGEVVATLVQRKAISPGGFGRSFLNDVLLAVSCRETGATLVTHNTVDFERIQQVEPFEFLGAWPRS